MREMAESCSKARGTETRANEENNAVKKRSEVWRVVEKNQNLIMNFSSTFIIHPTSRKR